MKRPIQISICLALFALFTASQASAITYEYDPLGRLTKVTYDDGSSIEYTYDAAGNRRARRIIE